MKRFFSALSLAAILACTAAPASAEVKTIELPTETATLKPGKGSELTTAYCMMCHSVEYITSQPEMPRKFWEAAVMKMKDKFGATIPDASVEELVDYLTDAYGKE